MSILIKNMQMPTSCNDCRFAVDGWCYAYPKQANGDALNRRVRTNWCPLIELQPHGDLIDKDATMNAILEERGEDTACWFAGIVNDMPAIVPSDKAEDGEG